jgi:hypothetical protein
LLWRTQEDRNLRGWIPVIGFLLILSLVGLAVVLPCARLCRPQDTVRPVSEITNNLGTQVAQVLNPTPTILPDPVTIIHGVRSLARLETIQYSVEKVITAEAGQGTFGFLFGDRLIFVAHGEVIAGVDLAKMGPQDLWVENNVLHMRVPEPEIFIATLNNEKSYVYNRYWRSPTGCKSGDNRPPGR